MAVLKYKSGDKVKTLGLVKSGVSGVSSVNGKTGAVTGLYDAENQPPYPVNSVNGKTGTVTGLYDAENQPPYPVNKVFGLTGNIAYPLINISEFPKQLDGYKDSLVSISFINPSSFTLPDGNTATFKVKFDSSFVCPIGVSRLGAGYNTQLSVSRDQNGDIIVTLTNHSGTGESISIGGYYLLTVFLSGAKIIYGVE